MQLLDIIVNKDKVLDDKIALAKVLKKLNNDAKFFLRDDAFIHRIYGDLCKNEFIKKFFKDIKIKNVKDDENYKNVHNIIDNEIYI